MPNLATIILIGHVGKDAELRSTQGGTQVASTSLAVNVSRDKEAKPDWYKLTFWGKLAETAAQYLTKGKAVCVIGTPKFSVWKDKEGTMQTTVEVNVRELTFLCGKDDAAPATTKPTTSQNNEDDSESLPF